MLKVLWASPWLLWLSGLSTILRTKRSPVWFPVGAHARVLGQVPSRGRVRGNHTWLFLSLSFSLPSPLSNNTYINKIFNKKRFLGPNLGHPDSVQLEACPTLAFLVTSRGMTLLPAVHHTCTGTAITDGLSYRCGGLFARIRFN